MPSGGDLREASAVSEDSKTKGPFPWWVNPVAYALGAVLGFTGIFGGGEKHDVDRTREAAIFVGADHAWDMGITGKGVTIGVVDDGVRADHQELVGRVIGRVDMIQYISFDPSVDGHGTSVASAAAGKSIGIAPGAQILDGRVQTKKGDFSSGRLGPTRAALAAHGARVINVSIGGQVVWPSHNEDHRQAVQDLRTLRPLVVQSAGNYKDDLTDVAAVRMAQQSGFMDKPTDDITLRGITLYVGGYDVANERPWAESAYPGADPNIQMQFLLAPACAYVARADSEAGAGYACGTSFSSAIVSGAAALLMSRWPQVPSDTIAQALLESARIDFTDQYGEDTCGPSGDQNCGLYYYGYGLLDIPAALDWMQSRFN
jgi:subtilisin family serine protease